MAKHGKMTRVRVLLLVTTLVVVSTLGYFVSLLARGYQFDSKNLKFFPNGILVIKSEPDGASIFLDGELEGATNSNLRLSPKTYDVEVKKDGFLTWSKRINIKKEEVTQVTAELFRTAPSFSPITFDGATNPIVSPDFSKVAFTNNNSLWILSVSTLPIGFNNSPREITDGITESAKYKFSPDSRQILLEHKGGTYVLDVNEFTAQQNRLNITNTVDDLLEKWESDKTIAIQSKLRGLPEELVSILTKNTSSLVFSPDEKMILYTASSEAKINENLIPKLPGSSTQAEQREIKKDSIYVYDIKEDKNFFISDNNTPVYWMPSSRHLINPLEGKVIIMDYDGTNRQAVFNGNYTSPHAYPYINSSKLIILTNLGSDENATNLYSVSIK